MKNRQRGSDLSHQGVDANDIDLLSRESRRSSDIASNAGSRFRRRFRSEYADAKEEVPRTIGWKTVLAAIVMFTASIVS